MSQWGDQRYWLTVIQDAIPLTEREIELIKPGFSLSCAEIDEEDFPEYKDLITTIKGY